MNSEYDVGYGKPPKNGQFRKGQSGNPNGRPAGSNNALTLLKRNLSKKIKITENGRKIKLSKLEIIIRQTMNAAVKGDLKATKIILDLLNEKGLMENLDFNRILPPNTKGIVKEFMNREFKKRGLLKKSKKRREGKKKT